MSKKSHVEWQLTGTLLQFTFVHYLKVKNKKIVLTFIFFFLLVLLLPLLYFSKLSDYWHSIAFYRLVYLIYTSQYLKENFTVRCIVFSLRTVIGEQTITFFATNNYNPIFHYKYKRLNTATYNLFHYKNKQTNKLEIEKPTALSFQSRGELFHFLDKLTFSVRIKSRKQSTANKRSKLNSSGIQLYSGHKLWKRAAHCTPQNCRNC